MLFSGCKLKGACIFEHLRFWVVWLLLSRAEQSLIEQTSDFD